MAFVTGIILASGSGERFGSDLPKQFLPLASKPVAQYSIDTMRASGLIDHILLVGHPEYLELAMKLGADQVIAGGPTRNASSKLGLCACPKATTHVMIHDAARPFLDRGILERCLTGLETFSAVAAAIPSTDTIYVTENDTVVSIPPRETLYRAQTPQAFRYTEICDAFEQMDLLNATDDLTIAIAHGLACGFVLGSEKNIKITSPSDFALAKQWLNS